MSELDILRRDFAYDPETGIFTRKTTRVHNAKVGQRAGCKNRAGYLVFHVGGKLRYAHRMAWLYVYGEEPPKSMDLDHANGDKADNRIANLRLATRAQNMLNCNAPKHNTTGRKGIKFCKAQGNWTAWILIDGRQRSLGRFATKDEAIAARIKGEIEHHKEFRRQV